MTGHGEPVTVFLHFRGHGASSAPETPWTYEALAGELRAVADHVGASRALGVSLGAPRLAMFDEDGLVWAHRRELRELIGGFLDGDDGRRG